jgi:hypothetical protein
MKYLLGIDFGGGASKATLLSELGEIVANKDVADGDIYTGHMIAPGYSFISRRMVSDDYAKEVLKDCSENTKTGRFEIEKCV